MNSLNAIKHGVQRLYATNPNIHINVSVSQPKTHLKNHPVTIKAVYPNVFRVEDHSGDALSCHTVQYAEVLTRQVEIIELMQQA